MISVLAGAGEQVNAQGKNADELPGVVSSAKGERPWAEGVSEKEQKAAITLFERGNHEFANRAYDTARKLYMEALTHWEHPAAQFNLSECLILLDKPVEAYKHLTDSMRFGVQPLGDAMLQRAVVRKQLLEGQLATLSVKNKEPGATVTLNGAPLFSGINEVTRIVKPGHFQIVATKSGFVTDTTTLTLLPAKVETVTVSLRRPSAGDVQFTRLWAAWKPWTVVGGGVLVGAASALLYSRAISDMDAYDLEIDLQCPNGCDPADLPSSTRSLKTRADRYNTWSVVGAGAAGTILVGGAVLVYLNQLHPEAEPSAMGVVAIPTRNGATASLTLAF